VTGDPPDVAVVAALVAAVDLWQSRTGKTAAVYVVGMPRGPARLHQLDADGCQGDWLLRWLSRRREHGIDTDPVLVIRTGAGVETVAYLGADDLTGLITLRDSGGRHATVTQPALAPRLLGAVVDRDDAPGDFGEAPYVPPAQEMPDDIYDERVLAYRTDDGMYPEAIWLDVYRKAQSTPWVCVINSDHLPDLRRIPYRYSVETERLARLAEKARPILLGVSTGRGLHFVSGLGADGAGRFHFRDPWGGRSLLCRENNTLGIAAQRDPDARTVGDWTIAADELRTAVRIALVWWRTWAELNAVEVYPRADDFTAQVFGPGRDTPGCAQNRLSEDAVEHRWRGVSDGAHRFDLRVTVDRDERVRWVRTTLDRTDQPGLWPSAMGVDVLSRVLRAVLAQSDLDELRPLLSALPGLTSATSISVHGAPAHLQQALAGAADVLSGAAARQYVPLLYSSLSLKRSPLWPSTVMIDVVLGESRLRTRGTASSAAVMDAALGALGLPVHDGRFPWEPRPGTFDAP
jgi:hypothetical protein